MIAIVQTPGTPRLNSAGVRPAAVQAPAEPAIRAIEPAEAATGPSVETRQPPSGMTPAPDNPRQQARMAVALIAARDDSMGTLIDTYA